MNKDMEYLSNEDLEKLISEIESGPQVQAPSHLEENVMASIEAWEQKKTISFYKYCVRVGFATAAAIAILCIVPFIPDTKMYLPSKEIVLEDKKAPSKDELLEGKDIRTKDEVLREKDNSTSYFDETQNQIRSYLQDLGIK